MSFLVLSHEHGLLPIAHRLQRVEDEEVFVLVKKRRYERAWHERFTNTARGSNGELLTEVISPLVERAETGDLIVLSDSPWVDTVFGNTKQLYGALSQVEVKEPPPTGSIRVGGWWNGDKLEAPHLLVADVGCWPGGLGPKTLGGLTLARISSPSARALYEQLTKDAVEKLQGTKFLGLVQVGVQQGETALEPQGMVAGWPFLQTHAFLSELECFGAVLRGEIAPFLPSRFVTVLPVSIPPWPNLPQTPQGVARAPIEGLTPQQQSRVFWHDMELVDGKLHTAGLDGLVGVARGAAENVALARGRALEIGLRVELPEKQLRVDVGQRVEEVLATLEQTLGVTL